MEFLPWLKKQRKRQDPVGDLARDTFRDTFDGSSQPNGTSYEDLRNYMSEYDPMPEAILAAKQAKKEWEKLT